MSRVHFFCVLILTSSVIGTVLGKDERSYWDKASEFGTCYGWTIAGGVVGAVALPVALPALGFGAGGIAAGSFAAKGMSAAATYGHGMAIISAAQSAGAAGVGVGTQIASSAATSFAGWYFGGCSGPDVKRRTKRNDLSLVIPVYL